MPQRQSPGFVELARRMGCWANVLLAMALFFMIGALVSLFNGEIGTTLQAVIAALLLTGIAIVIGRRVGRGVGKDRR